VVGLEFAGAVVLAILLLVELLTTVATSLGTGLALLVLAILVVIVLAAVLRGIWQGRAWVRAATVVVQVLIFAVGVGALQGAFAQPGWGWPLISIGVVGFGLLLSKPVAAWLNRTGDADSSAG
jgi:hypothetical protein